MQTSQVLRYVSHERRGARPGNREGVGRRESHRRRITHMQSHTQITEGVDGCEKETADTRRNAKPFWFGAAAIKALFFFLFWILFFSLKKN